MYIPLEQTDKLTFCSDYKENIMNELSTEFKYDLVDQSTADFLKQKEVNMREIVGKAYTELGRELKEAQDILAKNGYGCFQEWVESIGFRRQTAYKLIQRHNLIVHNVDERNLLEDLPVSLTYEIAGWSRISRRQKLSARNVQSVKMQSEVKVNDT